MAGLAPAGAHERDVLADERRVDALGDRVEVGQARRLRALGAAERQADAVWHDLQPAGAGRGDAVGQPARADRLGDDLDEAQALGARERAVDLRAPARAAAEPCDDRRRAAHDPPPPQPPPPQPPPPPPSEPPEPQLAPALAPPQPPRCSRRCRRSSRCGGRLARHVERRGEGGSASHSAPPPKSAAAIAVSPVAGLRRSSERALRWRLRISRPALVAGGRRRASRAGAPRDHADDPDERDARRRRAIPARCGRRRAPASSPPTSHTHASGPERASSSRPDARQVLVSQRTSSPSATCVRSARAVMPGSWRTVSNTARSSRSAPAGSAPLDLQRAVVGAALQQPVVVQLAPPRGDRQLRAAAEHRELVGVQLGQRVVAAHPRAVRIAARLHGRDRGDDAQADVDPREQRAADAPGCRYRVHGHSLHLSSECANTVLRNGEPASRRMVAGARMTTRRGGLSRPPERPRRVSRDVAQTPARRYARAGAHALPGPG